MVGLKIEIDGAKEVADGLRRIDRQLLKELKQGMKEDARPILQDARSYASGLGGSGQYAGSLSMRAIKDGVRIQSDDPGAGTIEFAHRGAYYLSGSRRGLPVGVPMGGPPRALVRASEENEDAVRRAVETRIERMIARYLNG